MREIAIKAAKLMLRRAGLEVKRPGGLDIHQQRKILLNALAVTLVIDVGANVGQYAGTHLRQWADYRGNIASFEPGNGAYEACSWAARNDPLWTVHSFGLSDAAGTARLHVPEGASDLSSLRTTTAVGARMTAGAATTLEEVPLRRLDDVIDGIATPHDRLALKLDVQGHEAAVLRGGRRALERVRLLECEMPLVAMYEGQETFGGLLDLITAAGFFPVGMRSNYVDPRTGFAMDADALFVRQGGETARG